MMTLGAAGGGIGAAVGGGRGVQVGVGAGGLGVDVGGAANAKDCAAPLVDVGAGDLGVDVGAATRARADAAVLVGVDSGVLVAFGTRVSVEVAVGSTGAGVAVTGSRAGAAWAGSVGLMASVAVGRASAGGAAAQAARRMAVRSPVRRAGSGDRGLTEPSCGQRSGVSTAKWVGVERINADAPQAGQLLACDGLRNAAVRQKGALAERESEVSGLRRQP